MPWLKKEAFYPCHSCKEIMIGIFSPIPENVYHKEVAREICYTCEQAAKTAEVVA